MQRWSLRTLTCVGALWISGGFIVYGDDDDGRKSQLSPPDGSGLPDAVGVVELDQSELEIKVKNLAPAAAYGVFLDDGTGALVEVGVVTTNESGEGEIEFEGGGVGGTGGSTGEDGSDGSEDDDDGDDDGDDEAPLPFGVTSGDQLAGRAIEVRDADGAVVLAGLTPDLRFNNDDQEGKILLSPPEPTGDNDPSGEMELRQQNGRIRIKVEIERLDAVIAYEVILTNPATGESVSLGVITTDENGEGQMRVDTAQGDPVPFGVGSVSELLNFEIAVNDPDGNSVLVGTVDSVEEKPEEKEEGEKEGESCLASDDPESSAHGEVEIEVHADGEEKFEVEVERVDASSVFDVILTDDTGTSASAGQLTTNAEGRGELQLKSGDSLPFGAASVTELSGLAVAVVDAAGSTVLSGTVADLGTDADCDGDDDDGDDGDNNAPRLDVEPQIDAEGEELEIELEHVAADTLFTIQITAADGSVQDIGAIATDVEGRGELKFDTEDGDALPLGAASVSELEGLEVSAVSPEGEVVASAVVPAPIVDVSGDGMVVAALEIDPFAVIGPFDAAFLRGDSNSDLAVDISDPIFTLIYLFAGGTVRPLCLDAADSNDDGGLDIADPVASLNLLFSEGASAVPEPGMFIPGFDPTPDLLHCEESPTL